MSNTRTPRTKGLFLKITPGDFTRASRDKRELDVARSLGLDTVVLTKGEASASDIIDGWTVFTMSTRPLGPAALLVRVNRLLSLATWASKARQLRPTIISGHDLIGIVIAWLSTLYLPRDRRPLLVYESQEFELGRNTQGRRGRLGRWVVRHLEGFLMRRCAFSIMVNDSIADRVQEIHELPMRPVVVRSVPPLWSLDDHQCAARRTEFCSELGMPESTFLLMYHGGVMPDRGIEISMRALVGRMSVALIILGNGAEAYLARLHRLAHELGVADRVLFREAVPLEVLSHYVGAADVGMVVVPPVTESYYLMLPNKFFENVQSLTPVIASNFPETSALVHKYDIGLLVDPEDAEQVAAAIDELHLNTKLQERFQRNLPKAKQDLCWENEKWGMVAAYEGLLK